MRSQEVEKLIQTSKLMSDDEKSEWVSLLSFMGSGEKKELEKILIRGTRDQRAEVDDDFLNKLRMLHRDDIRCSPSHYIFFENLAKEITGELKRNEPVRIKVYDAWQHSPLFGEYLNFGLSKMGNDDSGEMSAEEMETMFLFNQWLKRLCE